MYAMIGCASRDAFVVLSCPFWSTVLEHLKLLDRVVNGASFLTGGVFECNIAHCGSVVQDQVQLDVPSLWWHTRP